MILQSPDFPLCFLLEILQLWLSVKSMMCFEFIFFVHGVRHGSHFEFPYGTPIIPAPFAEKTILSPIYCFFNFEKNQLAHMCVCLVLDSVPFC